MRNFEINSVQLKSYVFNCEHTLMCRCRKTLLSAVKYIYRISERQVREHGQGNEPQESGQTHSAGHNHFYVQKVSRPVPRAGWQNDASVSRSLISSIGLRE